MNLKKMGMALLAGVFCFSASLPVEASIALTGERATADYWTARTPKAQEVLLTPGQIAAQNQDIRLRDTSLVNLATQPECFSGREVRQHIMAAMQDFWTEELPLEYVGKALLTERQWLEARQNCQMEALPEKVEVRYAVTTERTDLRLLPVAEGWYSEPGDVHYDDLQGTVLDPAEAVIIEHTSKDGRFAFVQAEDYRGWVQADKLALAEQEDWLRYAAPPQVAVVTVSRKYCQAGDRHQLYQLGAVIPLGKVQGETGNLQPAQQGLLLPTRDAEGRLVIENREPAYDDTLHDGYLPCTRENFIRMAFRCLGDEYGWGGQDDSVDCSSFAQDVYHTMGLYIPRDADHQETALLKQVQLKDMKTAARYSAVGSKAQPGDLLFKPGHVMIYLGKDDNGTPLAIHSASSYFTFEGGKQKHYVRQVLVSDLTYQNGSGVATIDGLTSIAGIWH